MMQRGALLTLAIGLVFSVSSSVFAQSATQTLAADLSSFGHEFQFYGPKNAPPNYMQWEWRAKAVGPCLLAVTMIKTQVGGDTPPDRIDHRYRATETTTFEVNVGALENAIPQHWNISYTNDLQRAASGVSVIFTEPFNLETTTVRDIEYFGRDAGKEHKEDPIVRQSVHSFPQIRTTNERGPELLVASFERAAKECAPPRR